MHQQQHFQGDPSDLQTQAWKSVPTDSVSSTIICWCKCPLNCIASWRLPGFDIATVLTLCCYSQVHRSALALVTLTRGQSDYTQRKFKTQSCSSHLMHQQLRSMHASRTSPVMFASKHNPAGKPHTTKTVQDAAWHPNSGTADVASKTLTMSNTPNH